MARWHFEPGHTAAEFSARHMMITWVRGFFKNISGELEFDPASPERGWVKVSIDARTLWTGEPDRDAHLKSADFLDVERFPTIDFRSTEVKRVAGHEFDAAGELTIRGVTKPVTLHVHYLGQWNSPWWEDGVDKGPVLRAGFVGRTAINRHDFEVSWNAPLERGGVVVSDEVRITLDAEAILDSMDPRRRP